MTIEDETRFSKLVVFEKICEKFRKEILQSKLVMAEDKLQGEDDAIHIIVSKFTNYMPLLRNPLKW